MSGVEYTRYAYADRDGAPIATLAFGEDDCNAE
jgi:hypothetical protein